MNRRALRILLRALVMSLLLSIWAGAGFCVQTREAQLLMLNERLQAAAGDTRIMFAPDLSGEYILYAFADTSAPVHAVVTEDGEVTASGELPLKLNLRAHATTGVYLHSEAPYTFEVMRASLGRNAENPITLTQPQLNRSLTRAYDVHWYRYVAKEDGEVLFRALSAVNGGVNASLLAITPDGQIAGRIYYSGDGDSAFVELKQNESCLLRVCAQGAETGNYTIYALSAQGGAAPEGIKLEAEYIHMQVGEWTRVEAALEPADAIGELAWETSDANVASVTSAGAVTAAGEGECVIWVHGFGGASAHYSVRVTPARVTGVRFASESITAARGDAIYADWNVFPPYAGDAEVEFSSQNEDIARVDANGLITCLSTGETIITVTTREGGYTAQIALIVTEPKPIYRALIVGISSYADGRERTGSVNTTQGMADALSQARYDGSGYFTDMRLDITKPELFKAIKQAFAGAQRADVSLFYINCHGGLRAGVAWLETSEGAKVSARELELALRAIPGNVIVIIDCCNSGAFIGEAERADSFESGVHAAFMRGYGKNAFASSKYKVLVSSSYDQNSYRIASNSPATEGNMSTVFARALTEGLGWNLIKDKTSSMKADLDKNRQITLHEAYLYAYKRCMYYLKDYTARQSAMVWPRGDAFAIVR